MQLPYFLTDAARECIAFFDGDIEYIGLRINHGETHTLITDESGCGLPDTFDSPVIVGFYESDDDEGECRDVATLREALMELYGPAAGQPLPPNFPPMVGAFLTAELPANPTP